MGYINGKLGKNPLGAGQKHKSSCIKFWVTWHSMAQHGTGDTGDTGDTATIG